MFNKALYYPSINIENEEWLKTSSLYWDQISTIVPANMGNPYDYNCEFLESEGILSQEIVKSKSLKSATFRNQVIEYLSDYEKYYSHMIKNERTDRNRNRMYLEKIDPKLHGLLERYFDKSNGDYLYVDDSFADFYMTLLANYIAKRKGYNLITDSRISNQISIGISNENPSILSPRRTGYDLDHAQRLYESLLAHITIKHYGISPDTDIKKIVKFRKKYKDNLSKYRGELRKLSSTLKNSEFSSFESLNSAIETIIKDEIQVSVNDLEKALHDQKITSFIAPISATGIIGLASSFVFNPVVTVTASCAAVTSQIVMAKKKTKKTLRENNFSYLQLVDKNF